MDGSEIGIGAVNKPFAQGSLIFQHQHLPRFGTVLRGTAVEEDRPPRSLIIMAIADAETVHFLVQQIPIHEVIVQPTCLYLEALIFVLQVSPGEEKVVTAPRPLIYAVVLQRRFQKQMGRQAEHRKQAETPRFHGHLLILPLPGLAPG